MTDRIPAERPTACPFLAFEDDRDYRSDRPDHRHRCFAEARPAPRAISHQELFCLGGAFGECPTFASWAAREAAAVKRPTIRRTDAASAPRGTYPADRPSPGATGGFAAVGGAYATPPGYGTPAPQPVGTAQPAVGWQAPPPWIGEDAAGTAEAAPGTPVPRSSTPPPAGPAGSPYDDEGETPAFLAGRKTRPASSMPPAAAGAAAVSGAAAVGSAALIGGTSGGYEDDGLGGLVAGGTGSSGTAGPRPASRPSATSYAQPVSGRSGATSSTARPTPSSDVLWVQPDVDFPAEDEPWEDPVEAAAAARIARASRESGGSGSSRFGLGRSKPSAAGQARPLPHRAADPAAPAWERPRRFEAYPTIKSGVGGRPGGLPRILVWAGLLALAALALFLVPPFLLGGGSGGADATPTPAATAAVSAEPSVAPTPVPSPTPFTYKVKAGNTLSGIAAKYKVSVDDILAANPGLKDPNQLQIGDVLVIPLPASSIIPDAGTSVETASP